MASARGDVFSSRNLALTSHTMDPERVQKTSRGPSVPPSETSAWRAVVRVLRSTASGTLNSITSVVFPADCRICNLPLSGFSFLPVCNSCWNKLPEQYGVLCARCGESLHGEPPSDEAVCRVCRAAVQDALDLLCSQPVEHLDDFINGQTIFEVLENRRNRNARSPKDP